MLTTSTPQATRNAEVMTRKPQFWVSPLSPGFVDGPYALRFRSSLLYQPHLLYAPVLLLPSSSFPFSVPPSPLLFLSPLRFSFSATIRFPFPSSSLRFLFFRFLFFRSPLARFSRSNPSAFLRARFSSSSLTTHGISSTSFRNAVFSAQAAASSFVVPMMAVGTHNTESVPYHGPGARRRRRRTYPLKQHLLHFPERPHTSPDLDHGPNVHPTQIDLSTRSRDTFGGSITPAQDRRTLCWRCTICILYRRCSCRPSAGNLNRSTATIIEQRDPTCGIDV